MTKPAFRDTSPELRRNERHLIEVSPHGRLRLGIGYPNSYHVALSSLAHQWVVRLASAHGDVGVERFYADSQPPGRTFDHQTPLADLDILALTCSFELDAVKILTILDDAGIPRLSRQRTPRHPLIVVGGAVASINPLPLAPAVDVFCLGAAEILVPTLLEVVESRGNRDQVLEELAGRDGFFVPRHHLESSGRPFRRRRLEKRDRHMETADLVPASHIITPNTEYSSRGLIEMSRGCPEKCHYCWVSFNYGRLRCYPTEHILARVHELSTATRRIGMIATAVGDHPDLAEILEECRRLDLEVALSSLRIPAMVADVLRPLAESGARSVTIAPETGSEVLRRKLNKPISNDRILEAVDTAQRCGLVDIKMYFILGLPGETDDDVLAIAHLVEEAREIMLRHGRSRGRVGKLHAGVSILVPKPYTPYHSEPMLSPKEARRKIAMLRRATRHVSNFKLDVPSYRLARWQGFLSRGTTDAFEVLERAADGVPVGRLLSSFQRAVAAATTDAQPSQPVWNFIGSAPVPTVPLS